MFNISVARNLKGKLRNKLMRRLFASLTIALFLAATVRAFAAAPADPVSGPLVKKFTGQPPAVKVGGESATDIKAKMKSGDIKTVKRGRPTPDNVKVTNDVEYGKVGNRALTLDLFEPKDVKRPVPGLIFVHGGSWKGGSRKHYTYYCEHFASEGYVAATIDYRLSGEAPFPAAIQDVKCAIRWMRANAAKLHVDPDRIGLAGGSAGGHLVLLAAYSHTDDPELEGNGGYPGVSSKVQAVVDLYGPVELRAGRRGSVYTFMGNKSTEEAPELYAKASPITHLTKDAPPTLILHGTVDELVPIGQSDKLAAKLTELGVPYAYDRLPGWHHAMDIVQEVNVRCVWFMDQFFAQTLPLPK